MGTNTHMLERIKGKLIVSCQALPGEPLHSPFIMGRMAYAAFLGGAAGIRANSIQDIQEIKKSVKLPIIGIIKRVYEGSEVFITPTMREVKELYLEGVDIIAVDATDRIRPDGSTISEQFPLLRAECPNQLFMADCSTYEDAERAIRLGFDCVGTTLSGYTSETKGTMLPDIELMRRIASSFDVPVIAEGGVSTPEELKKAFEAGVHAAVVGAAITRPLEITKRFVQAIAPTKE